MSQGPPPSEVAPVSDDAWEDPPRHKADPGRAPVLAVDGWDGPLDWLLELARSRRIDLAKLPILGLVEAFATALEDALARRGPGAVALGTLGDWVVMAATLALLRSRLLLPRDDAAARQAHAEAEALRRQLVDRAATAAAADWLDGRCQLGRDVFARGQPEAAGQRSGRVGDITGLFRACLVALQLQWDAEAAYRPPAVPPWTVAQATARIRRMLAELPEARELGAFIPEVPPDAADRERRCRASVAVTFCGSLELARDQSLTLDQLAPWAALTVRTTGSSLAAGQDSSGS